MAIILEYSEVDKCSKCNGSAKNESAYCENGNNGCPEATHHHMRCDKCSFRWLMMAREIVREPFSEDIICKKCGISDSEKISCSFCIEEHQGKKSDPHHHIECDECEYRWIMDSAEINVERDFDDLDQFTEICPKCMADNIDFSHVGDEGVYKCRELHKDMDIEGEHLHAKCEYCSYEWSSVTADFVESKEDAPEDGKPTSKVKEAKISGSA